MKSDVLFKATVEGYANAYESEKKSKVVMDVDYRLDLEKFGIIALTDKGREFLKFVQNLFTAPKK